MIRIVCDKCGKEIPEFKAGRISWGYMSDGGGNIFENCHFCSRCMEAIKAFIQMPEGQDGQIEDGLGILDADGGQGMGVMDDAWQSAAEKAPEIWAEPQKGMQKREVRIDVGRIMALRDARWTVRAIADDMGLTDQQVSEAICRQHKRSMSRGDG